MTPTQATAAKAPITASQHLNPRSDIKIAQAAKMRPILDIAREKLGIGPENLEPYGHYKAKLSMDFIKSLESRPNGKLILVTAITPTPAGEGKTTTTVGLGDALNKIGKRAIICLREPSLGPSFGMKGGAAGGGYAQVVPMEDINLHFTGDFHAIGAANNLLAALVDNHIYWGNAPAIDSRRVTWRRGLDMNDRALRSIVSSLGGVANGFPREDGFDITVASEVMAIFCLATDVHDLKRRLGNIIVAQNRAREPVRASELKAAGSMAVLLIDALAPNLVQTLENSPAFIHGGPFSSVCTRFGANASISSTAIEPAAFSSLARTGSRARFCATMMLPRRRFRSCTSVARQKIAITSEATVMSNPSSRGKPLATPPREETIERKARSFMSRPRRQVTRRESMAGALPQ